MLLEKDLPEN